MERVREKSEQGVEKEGETVLERKKERKKEATRR